MKGNKFRQYYIENKLGAGGMATVYLATHIQLGHRVALKVLHTQYQDQPTIRTRFLDEAKIQANLRHPNILQVMDIIDSTEATALVMEYLDGCTLKEYYYHAGVPMPAGQVIRVFSQIADALELVHQHGVVHRDLKPSNIFLHVDSNRIIPKLMDFGVAKLRADHFNEHITTTGMVIGTPHYMAPEQYDDSSSVDNRSDIFSLGVMLYQASTGIMPFRGRRPASHMKSLLTMDPERPAGLVPRMAPGLDEVILTCLEKNPSKRYQSAGALVTALQNLQMTLGEDDIPVDNVPRRESQLERLEFHRSGKLVLDGANTISANQKDKDEGSTEFADELLTINLESSHAQVASDGLQIDGYQLKSLLLKTADTSCYRACRDGKDKDEVLIKVINSVDPEPDQVARLNHEHRLMGALKIPGVPQVHGLDWYGQSVAMIMEGLDGIPLRQVFRSEDIDVKRFIDIAIKIVELLGKLHSSDLIHCHLTPDNIFVNPRDDSVFFLDFSLAEKLGKGQELAIDPRATPMDPKYSSPEQTGRMNRPMDHRGDFYILGICFYEILTGEYPFKQEDEIALLANHMLTIPLDPVKVNLAVPPMLSDMILKMMAKQPERRYQSARGLSYDLLEVRNRLEDKARAENFTLGQGDVSDRFTVAQSLYGRRYEVDQLLSSFNRTSQGYKEFVLVNGLSGIGKTRLVQEVHKPITTYRGFFQVGKFDQFKRAIPFGGFIEAFQEMLDELLEVSGEQFKYWRTRLKEQLGVNAGLMTEVLPRIEMLLGPQEPVPALPPEEAMNRLELTYLNLINAFSSREHPLVIFLDDLQWADTNSLNLIKLLLTAGSLKFFMLIGSYRTNEVDVSHPLTMLLEKLEHEDIRPTRLELGPLQTPYICQLAADTLNCTLEEAEELSEYLEGMTRGNPFFIGLFLKALHERKLIEFSLRTGRWCWNMSAIVAEGLPDDMIQLMCDKILGMGPATRKALKLAACIGNQFSLQMLSGVYGGPPLAVINALEPAVNEGMVQKLSEAYLYTESLKPGANVATLSISPSKLWYKFVHDKIQQAAYSLIDETAKPKLHQRIGDQLRADNQQSRLQESYQYEMVNQLNLARELLTDVSERLELASLNQVAARRARSAGAYQQYLSYVDVALELMSDDAWISNHRMMMDLSLARAEALYLCVQFSEMEALLQETEPRLKHLEDRIRVVELRIQGLIAIEKKLEAISMGLDFLESLGFHVPNQPTQASIMGAIPRIFGKLIFRKIEDLQDLPEMEDESSRAAMKVISKISSTAYVVNPNLFALLVFLQVRLSIVHGNYLTSPFAYALFGTINCGKLNLIRTGYRFGRLALNLEKKLGTRRLTPECGFTVACSVDHYSEPLANSVATLYEIHQISLESGNLEFAGASAGVLAYALFFSASSLREVENRVASHAEVVAHIKQQSYLNYMKTFLQLAKNLQQHNRKTWILKGKYFNEEETLPKLIEAADWHGVFNVHFAKMMLQFLFGETSLALESALSARAHVESILAMPPYLAFHFHEALVLIAAAREAGREEASTRDYLAQVRKNLKLMKKWAASCPADWMGRYLLIQAELSRLSDRVEQAGGFYDRAIETLISNNKVQDLAMAFELAADFHLSLKRETPALGYLSKAIATYQTWGAIAKLYHLEEIYRGFVEVPLMINRLTSLGTPTNTKEQTAGTRTTTRLKESDFSTIMAVGKSIMAVTNMNLLLEKVTVSLCDAIGAQRVVIILATDSIFHLEADYQIGEGEMKVDQHIPVSDCEALPQSVVRFVIHLRKTVVLGDGGVEGEFTRDSYLMNHRARSVLCMPLLHNETMIGLLYLEHKVLADQFTPDKVEMLKNLSGKIVDAIFNTRRYQDLETRNRELEQQLKNLSET